LLLELFNRVLREVLFARYVGLEPLPVKHIRQVIKRAHPRPLIEAKVTTANLVAVESPFEPAKLLHRLESELFLLNWIFVFLFLRNLLIN
jgi:hypothetical protein